MVGDNLILLGCTCWGDFFYVSMNNGEFYIVLPDQFNKFQMGNSFSSVFDMNFSSDSFQRDILRLDSFEKYKAALGELQYGEIYAYDRNKKAASKQNASLFLDVAGQTGRQL